MCGEGQYVCMCGDGKYAWVSVAVCAAGERGSMCVRVWREGLW